MSPLKSGQRELLIKSFCNDVTATQAARFADVDRNTANLWFSIIRQLIIDATKNSPRFKGVVEMDQAFFGRKRKKKKVKRPKHGLNYGLMGVGFKPGWRKGDNRPEDLLEVFGVLERGKPNRVYTHIVKRGDRKTLIPIVHLVVEGESTIYSDAHRSFDNIRLSGYEHGVINKQKHFVTMNGKVIKPLKSTHINTIESFWGMAKERLRKFRGIRRSAYPIHIKECEFRYNHRHDLEKSVRGLLSA